MEIKASTGSSSNQFTPRTFTKSFPTGLLGPGRALAEAWPRVTSALEINGISCQLKLNEGSMTISTTRNYTGEQVRFHTATQLILLLSKGAPAAKALNVLNVGSNGMRLEFINLFDLAEKSRISKEKYWKRSKQLVGSTLQDLSKLAGCGFLFHIRRDGVIAYTADVQGLNLVRRIVRDCIVCGVRPSSQIKKKRRSKRKADKKMMKRVLDDLGKLSF